MSNIKRIAVLGCTGSIGTQTLDVVRQHPDKLAVTALACGRRVDQMIEAARAFGVHYAAAGAPDAPAPTLPVDGIELGRGMDDVVALVNLPEVDLVVNALVGAAGLRASLATIEAGKVLWPTRNRSWWAAT
jgi:1-deoxy-D-xylulose-5-phosphate reductoisomerase